MRGWAIVPRSMTRNQIDNLGNRLRKAARPSPEDDLELLQKLRSEYDPALAEASQRLAAMGEQATGRLKTVTTIIEKLRRDKTRLSVMQDIAGLRIVRDMTLSDQRRLARQIQYEFGGGRIHDRVAKPNFGYRAVHVIVEVDGCPVEIQIRTLLQDNWAQAMEGIADAAGREVRYGGPPADPEDAEAVEVAVAVLQELSDHFGRVERLINRRAELQLAADRLGPTGGGDPDPELDRLQSELAALQDEEAEVDARNRELLAVFLLLLLASGRRESEAP